MPIDGFVDYKRREYCNDIKCSVQMLLTQQQEGSEQYEKVRDLCKNSCIHTTYEFHHWLMNKGFELVKPEDA